MQTKIDSVLEALVNILIGGGIALIAQIVLFPLLGHNFTMTENLITSLFFTIISFIRSFAIRRLFNGRSVYSVIRNTILRKLTQNSEK